jgi:hypothetical protein
LKQAVKDVERFLFYPEQAKWILKLPEYLDSFKINFEGGMKKTVEWRKMIWINQIIDFALKIFIS